MAKRLDPIYRECLDIDKQRCKAKTAYGNIYHDKAWAKRAASLASKHSERRVRAYRCKHCRLWHIGKISELTK